MGKNEIKDNMSDLEIRVLGSESNIPTVSDRKDKAKRKSRKIYLWLCATLVLILISVLCTWLYLRHNASMLAPDSESVMAGDTLSVETLRYNKNTGPVYVNTCDTTINDIPLRIFSPVGGHMELFVGHNPGKDSNVILAVHAADLRGDDGTPAGAFVYKGELIAKGHSKYGFCAILNGEVSIGRQIETPLFERTIEQNGSFFRQYSIVSNGKLMTVPPKGKAVRRALCLKDSTFLVVESYTAESYHDFSLALQDMGVSEALALVGGNAAVIWRDKKGSLTQNGDIFGDSYSLENYILWRK